MSTPIPPLPDDAVALVKKLIVSITEIKNAEGRAAYRVEITATGTGATAAAGVQAAREFFGSAWPQ